ncbi:MAG: thioredoxin fold domain-containing protein [Rhodospirillaceae bacterium]|jgi:thioredoxin-related protein|nr:thioredoxin fold domain-containing protein [Rhodospirillaceae bacterium]
MKTNISNFVLTIFLAVSIFTITPLPTDASEISPPTLGEDGLYRQSWFLESFLDIKEDMQTAQANGKRLVVFIEQKGCIYCKKVQTEILVDPRINAYVRKHFEVLQIDLWGHKEVTDLDGEVTTEKKVSRKWRSLFTPTIVFMPESVEQAKGKSGGDAAVAIMPGAFGKGTFLALFEWVHNKGYEKGEHFQKYVNDRYWEKRGGRPKQ